MKKLLLLALTTPLWAQTPTVSAISTANISDSGVQVLYTVNTQSYVQVYYDIQTAGVCPATYNLYQWKTKVAQLSAVSLAIDELKPNVIYCVQPAAKPNSGNDTNICAAAGCGATPFTFTTSNLSVPQSPAAPTAFSPTAPVTSGYTVVTVDQESGACGASANFTNPGSWGGNIAIGDSMQTIITTIGNGTAIVRLTGDCTQNSAISLRTRSSTSWIVIEGTDCSASNTAVPPFGSRLTTAHDSLIHTMTSTAATVGIAQFIDQNDQTPQYYWFRCLHLKFSSASGTFNQFARLISTFTTGSNLNNIVFDRNHFEGDTRVDIAVGIALSGNNFAMIGNYIENIQRNNNFAFGAQVVEGLKAAGGPYTFDNNFIQTIGSNLINDDQGTGAFANNDWTVTRNTFSNGLTNIPSTSGSGGYGNNTRSPFEVKRAFRGIFKGNWCSYWYATQSDGSCALFSARGAGQQTTAGIIDWLIQSNIASHGHSGFNVSNGNPDDNGGLLEEPQPLARVHITNNLAYDLSTLAYCPDGGSYVCGVKSSNLFTDSPGAQDLVIDYNTAGPIQARLAPAIFYTGQCYGLTNYLLMQNNVFTLSRSSFGAGGFGGISSETADGPCAGNGISFSPPIPANNFSNTGASPNFAANLTAGITQLGSTVSPGATWTGNILVGGEYQPGTGGAGSYGVMDQATLNTYATNWPAGDTIPSGATMAARFASIGMNTTTWACSGCSGKGVNTTTLYQDMGRVTGISVNSHATSATFTYTSPDTRACGIRLSTDSGVTYGNYTADAGGSTARTTTLSGLTTGLLYMWQLLCYYPQANDGQYITDYASTELTSGSFTTGTATSQMFGQSKLSGKAVLK